MCMSLAISCFLGVAAHAETTWCDGPIVRGKVEAVLRCEHIASLSSRMEPNDGFSVLRSLKISMP
jgi:hypothetical protein